MINRGFGGSHISDVIHYADRIVLPYRPKVILLYAGDNDVGQGKPPQQVIGDYHAFTGLVWKQLPETSIVFLPIKPSRPQQSRIQNFRPPAGQGTFPQGRPAPFGQGIRDVEQGGPRHA